MSDVRDGARIASAQKAPLRWFINRFGTPLTAGLFFVSTITGVALFFHWGTVAIHSMHVWLSMVLLVPFALHLLKNWPGIMGYARRKTLLLPLAVCVLMAVPFIMFSKANGGRNANSGFRALSLITATPLSVLAPILKTDSRSLRAVLKQHGYTVASDNETLDTIAASSGARSSDLLLAVIPKH